ncbi:MAG: hypothetical protein NTY15_17870 [Planctomycetota bacterium]|nr:hypothetical protein [Planctomycetota bacterium]
MRQVVHCHDCNSQIPTPESIEGKPSPQFLKCEACGNQFFWNGGLTDKSEPLILFPIEDPVENMETSEVAEIESSQESTDHRSAQSDSDDTNQIVDLEIKELDIESPLTESPQTAASETAASETADVVVAASEIEPETQIEPVSQPQSLVHSGSAEEPTETSASDTQSHESEQLPLGSLEPKEHVIVQQMALGPPNQTEQEPIVNNTVTEPFELELEIELEPDAQFTVSETHQLLTTENVTENAVEEIVANYKEEPFALGEPYLETEPIAETPAIETAPIAEQALLVDSSPAVDWSVLGPTAPRRRPKEASAIRKILPPVLGGLAAFPIATLILWYGFGKDIGTTGPTVAKYVPWIVPEKFRSMPFESSPSNFASGRTQRSAPSTRNTLPTLNREETSVPPNDQSNAIAPTISKKPTVEKENPTKLTESKAESVRETTVAKIPETIEALKTLQKEMEKASDNKVRMKVLVAIDTKLKELSKQSYELTGPSARAWSKQLEAISRKILADSVIPGAMKKIANKVRAEIPVSKSGDFVATVIAVSDANAPSQDDKWLLQERWESDTVAIPIEVLPGAWRPGSSPLPATCLVLGRLLTMEDSDASGTDSEATGAGLVLKVHLLVPK